MPIKHKALRALFLHMSFIPLLGASVVNKMQMSVEQLWHPKLGNIKKIGLGPDI